MRQKVWLSWSTGKDSAWALYKLRQEDRYDVCALFTTVNESFDRVSMHAVRRALLKEQALATGLPLYVIDIPWPCSNTQYEKIMAGFCQEAVEQEVQGLAFGDLFLEDVRQYRISRLQNTLLEPLFPLWNIPTSALAREMIHSGLRSKLTCVDPTRLDSSFAGRDFDLNLLSDLPATVDPCGENGEFHSFAYSGPMFKHPIRVRVGEVTKRDGFVFADVLPENNQFGKGPE